MCCFNRYCKGICYSNELIFTGRCHTSFLQMQQFLGKLPEVNTLLSLSTFVECIAFKQTSLKCKWKSFKNGSCCCIRADKSAIEFDRTADNTFWWYEFQHLQFIIQLMFWYCVNGILFQITTNVCTRTEFFHKEWSSRGKQNGFVSIHGT